GEVGRRRVEAERSLRAERRGRVQAVGVLRAPVIRRRGLEVERTGYRGAAARAVCHGRRLEGSEGGRAVARGADLEGDLAGIARIGIAEGRAQGRRRG